MIEVRQGLVVVKTLPSEVDESVIVELKYENKNVRFQVELVYNPPTGNKQDFLYKLDSFHSSFQSASMPIFVCGDFNIVVIRENQLVEQVLNDNTSNGFEQVVKEVTRVCETTQSCLDHFIFQNIHIFGVEILGDQCFSDLFPVLFEWKMGFHIKQTQICIVNFR